MEWIQKTTSEKKNLSKRVHLNNLLKLVTLVNLFRLLITIIHVKNGKVGKKQNTYTQTDIVRPRYRFRKSKSNANETNER